MMRDYWSVKPINRHEAFKDGKLIVPEYVKYQAKERVHYREYRRKEKERDDIISNPAYRVYVEVASESADDKVHTIANKHAGVIMRGGVGTGEYDFNPLFFPRDDDVTAYEIFANEKGGRKFIDSLFNKARTDKIKFDVY